MTYNMLFQERTYLEMAISFWLSTLIAKSMMGGKGQSCVDMHVIWARNMTLYYIIQSQIEFLNFTDRKFLFLYTLFAFCPWSQDCNNGDLWDSWQAEFTIMKLTEERRMTNLEKDRLKHELVSNSLSRTLFYHIVHLKAISSVSISLSSPTFWAEKMVETSR